MGIREIGLLPLLYAWWVSLSFVKFHCRWLIAIDPALVSWKFHITSTHTIAQFKKQEFQTLIFQSAAESKKSVSPKPPLFLDFDLVLEHLRSSSRRSRCYPDAAHGPEWFNGSRYYTRRPTSRRRNTGSSAVSPRYKRQFCVSWQARVTLTRSVLGETLWPPHPVSVHVEGWR